MNLQTPKIITRVEWGAIEPSKPYFPQIPKQIMFHHYGITSKNSNARLMKSFKGIKTIQKLQKMAIANEGLIDIQYHYVIAPDGTIYECRPDTVMGKHCKSYDNGTISIMCFGNFNAEQPPAEMKVSIVWLVRRLASKYKSILVPDNIVGHCDKKLTSCPGVHLNNFLRRLKLRCRF